MDPLQAISADLLLQTGASRAMIQRRDGNGAWVIVAESVAHGLWQLRHAGDPGGGDETVLARLETEPHILAVETAAPGGALRARLLAPVMLSDRLVGVVSIERSGAAPQWRPQDHEALAGARDRVLARLIERGERSLAADGAALREAAIQVILDRLRETLAVQRCTFRQNVMASYAFPVTQESRAAGVRSLLGDFTIVQSGQPVIEKLLTERAQVVQEDCRIASQEPLFHVMLRHYGDMRAQIVTPFIRDDELAGVLSIHDLRAPRIWTREEKELARDANQLIGHLAAVALP